MTANNHPNRNPARPGARPTGTMIRTARLAARLEIDEAAHLVHESARRWLQMEMGEIPMHPAAWELWRLKVERAQPLDRRSNTPAIGQRWRSVNEGVLFTVVGVGKGTVNATAPNYEPISVPVINWSQFFKRETETV